MKKFDPYVSIDTLYRAYRKGDLSPVEVIDGHLAREDRLEGKLKAYVTRYSDEAREQARAAEQAFGSSESLPPLTGVPIALKDLVDMEGRPTMGGSPERHSRVSPGTAIIAARLISAGAIISGKTHTVEMAMGGWGTNEHLGTPWNPWDLKTHRTPGGSSSGSGVAVAAGYCPGAIGTDTGGSVRLPAAWCGLVGLKVTEGALPTNGILPLSSTLDTPGPLTRSVDDALIMFEVLKGADAFQINKDLEMTSGPFAAIRKPASGLTLAVLRESERNDIDPEVLTAYDKAVDCLADLGADIVTRDMPNTFEGYAAEAHKIVCYEGYRFNREIIDNDGAVMDPWVKLRLTPGRDMTEVKYQEVLAQRMADRMEFEKAFEGVDALLTPTIATPPIPLGDVDQHGTPARFTRIGNYLGLCSLAVPNGFTKSGLPLSLLITCHGNQEIKALSIGKAYEAENDWGSRHPGGLDV